MWVQAEMIENRGKLQINKTYLRVPVWEEALTGTLAAPQAGAKTGKQTFILNREKGGIDA